MSQANQRAYRAGGIKKYCSALFILILIIGVDSVCSGREIELAIRPLGNLQKGIIDRVTDGIGGVYRLKITLLPTADLPSSAYYGPNKRYRAEKLLDFLDDRTPGKYDRVLGLTDRDISTTKGDIHDWGIFGLGSMNGRSCVVSTFRLLRGADREKFMARLIKVVNHELGHTLGLPHCPSPRCLMGDAKGTIVTVDRETGDFCALCKKRLRKLNICKTCDE